MSSSFRRGSRRKSDEKGALSSSSSCAFGSVSSSPPSCSSSSWRESLRQGSVGIGGSKGTKAWTGGITLASSGLRELDQILGGGQPLGTCLLVEEDRWSRDFALCLIKYWCAEAVSHEQELLFPYLQEDDGDEDEQLSTPPALDDETEEIETWYYSGPSPTQLRHLLDILPRNLHIDKNGNQSQDVPKPEEHGFRGMRPLQMLEEADDEGEDGDGENISPSVTPDAEGGLRIAWQYRKDVQKERLGHGASGPSSSQRSSTTVYCHSFDLSGRLKDQITNKDMAHIVDCTCTCAASCCYWQQPRTCGMRLYVKVRDFVRERLRQIKEESSTCTSTTLRLLLYRAPSKIISVTLPLLMTYIRQHELPVVVMVSVQPWNTTSDHGLSNSMTSLRRLADVVLQMEGFGSRARERYPPPPEYQHLQGLLHVPKVSTVTAATANGMGHFADMTLKKRPAAHMYGLKRDRRKLHILLLHIPPEEFAGGNGGSVSGFGVRSGAGRKPAGNDQREDRKKAGVSIGCGSSGIGGDSSLLDF